MPVRWYDQGYDRLSARQADAIGTPWQSCLSGTQPNAAASAARPSGPDTGSERSQVMATQDGPCREDRSAGLHLRIEETTAPPGAIPVRRRSSTVPSFHLYANQVARRRGHCLPLRVNPDTVTGPSGDRGAVWKICDSTPAKAAIGHVSEGQPRGDTRPVRLRNVTSESEDIVFTNP